MSEHTPRLRRHIHIIMALVLATLWYYSQYISSRGQNLRVFVNPVILSMPRCAACRCLTRPPCAPHDMTPRRATQDMIHEFGKDGLITEQDWLAIMSAD